MSAKKAHRYNIGTQPYYSSGVLVPPHSIVELPDPKFASHTWTEVDAHGKPLKVYSAAEKAWVSAKDGSKTDTDANLADVAGPPVVVKNAAPPDIRQFPETGS